MRVAEAGDGVGVLVRLAVGERDRVGEGRGAVTVVTVTVAEGDPVGEGAVGERLRARVREGDAEGLRERLQVDVRDAVEVRAGETLGVGLGVDV